MEEVKEGFLCPICLADLGNVTRLQTHFNDTHIANSSVVEQSSARTAPQNVKTVLDKAKRKILGKTDEYDKYEDEIKTAFNERYVEWEPQEIGYCRDWTREFRKIRSETVDDDTIETNTILIRLEKIMKASCDVKDSKSSARKAAERRLVPWMSDSEARLCFVCRKSFSVTRRKHHCRLCGKVICAKCSQFLPWIPEDELSKLDGMTELPIEWKSESGESAGETDSLRVCSKCDDLLRRHYESLKDKRRKIPLVKLYEKMTNLMAEADLRLPDFNKMAESLSFGDTRYSYSEVVDRRMKLLKYYEALEILSKKVLALVTVDKTDENQPQIGVQTQKLHRGVHAFVVNYLQANMFTLKSIPSQQEYERLQKDRSTLLRKRAEREREQQERIMKERALLHKEALKHERENSPALSRKHLSTRRDETNPQVHTLLQQINNVEGYLRTARENGNNEEATALKLNLDELKTEYNKLTNR